MSKVNRRGFFGWSAGLATFLGVGTQGRAAISVVPQYPPTPGTIEGPMLKADIDPLWHVRRIAELKDRLATFHTNVRYEVSAQDYIESLRSVSPVIKRLYHAQHRRAHRIAHMRREILMELSHMGPPGL